MGLLANNPYAVANPIAEALNGLRSGFKEGYNGALDRQKAEQLAAQQAELLQFQRQEAQRKQEQAALEAKARDQFAALRASQQGAARQGLMGGLTPEMPNLMALAQPAADQYGYADFGPQMIPSERQTRAVDSVVANVLPSQKDLLGFAMQYGGTQAGDNAMKAAQVLPTGNELRDKLLATGKYTPESVDAFVGGTGKLSFAKDPSVVTWSEPYAAQVGGKKVMLQRSSTGQIKPVVEDKSTTTVVRYGDNTPLQQSTFVDPESGKPLVYDKKTGSYRVANVAGVAKQVPVKVASELSANTAAISKLDNALQLAESNPSAFGMSNYLGDEVRQRTDPRGVPARAAVADIGSLTIHDRSGAAVTASEFPRLKPFIPAATDSPKTVKEKLARFKQIVSEEDRLYRQGLTSNGYRVGGNQPSSPPQPRPGFKVQRNKTTGEYREVPI